MKTNGTITAEVQGLLPGMVAEAQALPEAADGTVADTVAGGRASQYLVAAQDWR